MAVGQLRTNRQQVTERAAAQGGQRQPKAALPQRQRFCLRHADCLQPPVSGAVRVGGSRGSRLSHSVAPTHGLLATISASTLAHKQRHLPAKRGDGLSVAARQLKRLGAGRRRERKRAAVGHAGLQPDVSTRVHNQLRLRVLAQAV